MDITQLIAEDHTEQRCLFALIEELEPDDGDALQAVWTRLRVLLDTHALAEGEWYDQLRAAVAVDEERLAGKRSIGS